MLKIYHNPRCKKSREGVEMIRSFTSDYQLVEYIKNGLTANDINEILLKSNLHPLDIIRTQEDLFRHELKGKLFNREEWIHIICENPNLLKRPFVVGKHRAVLADCVSVIVCLEEIK